MIVFVKTTTADRLIWSYLHLMGCFVAFAVTTLSGCAIDGIDHQQNLSSPLNATYVIGDQKITLVNGFAETSAVPHSSTKITTEVWGTPEFADLNGDGQEDAALILIHSSGGSGTFYYVAAAIRYADGYHGTSAVLLGDRIEARNIDISNNRITVEFLDRARSDAFSAPPSVPMKQLVIYDCDTKQLAQVVREFAGEADPERMMLPMKTWYWVKTSYNDDSIHTPTVPDVFSLVFQTDGKLIVTTDCNNMRGNYQVMNHRLNIEQLISTRMYCENSQEQLFANMLQNVNSYFFTSHGKLVLELKYDSGAMIFR
jgi:heat shock protein HslJ